MKIVIWIQNISGNKDLENLNRAANILAQLYGNIEILGAIEPQGIIINEIKSISKDDLKNLEFDLILVAGQNANIPSVLKEIENFGIDADKIILDRTVCVPNFTLEKYNRLRRSQLSILSMNCFAGLLYHRFGLPFLTPTINMFTTDEGFLKFLNDPVKNIKATLKLLRMERNEALKIDYPVYKIGATEWNMNHYGNINIAKQKWIERGNKINWFNLLVTMYTENPEILAEFDKLPFSKKVCLVPFKSDLDSAYCIDSTKYVGGNEFWRIVNGVGIGSVSEFDMWDMLIYGKKTPIIKQ